MTSRDEREFGAADARGVVSPPTETDDKYSRGVVGFVTGSREYPGAAVLGVSAAYRTGVGMVRYVGPKSVGRLVLDRRPEAVLGMGAVQAWVIGSGVSALHRDDKTLKMMCTALESGQPVVMDAGALDLVTDLPFPNRVIITPHIRELSRLMSALTDRPAEWSEDVIASDPAGAAARVAAHLGVVVSLKGFVSHVVTGDGVAHAITSPTTWLSTAGTGDVLAGIMGAVLATTRPESATDLARCAATAVYLHGRAAHIASHGGSVGGPAGRPIAALDVADALPEAVREALTA